ncbi:MAG: NAD-dependent deacetylase [Acidiferrobacterales bacterium]
MDAVDSSLGELTDMLDACACVVVFTGAGISTESGIPDFRSPTGIWSRMKPIDYQDYLASEQARRESWRRRLEIDRELDGARPNRGHRAVATLVDRGKATWVVTQNIDGLHQQSGIPEDQVIELHGNTRYARCLDCGERYELAPIFETFAKDETLPVCTYCSGVIKTATISFGQPMPEEAMRRAFLASMQCDLFLAVGSSLAVYPAADFPVLAKANGARLVIVNREATGLDAAADLVVNAEIGFALGAAVGVD